MHHKDKLIEFYSSGRYECDVDFHHNLHQAITQLNLYQWQPSLQTKLNCLHKIRQLTQINANCLHQDYDDEQGICQTYKIKSLINTLNHKDIPAIMQECKELNWQPYQTKVLKILKKNHQFMNIIQRIQTTVHSDEFRIDSMIFTTFFHYVHYGQNLMILIEKYQQTIEYFLQFLNQQRDKFKILLEHQDYTNISHINKVKVYVGTMYCIIRCCLRFCQILKILTGKNNLSLKYTVIKKELDKLVKQYPEWTFQTQKEDLFKSLPIFKGYLKTQQPINTQNICHWCFKILKTQQKYHSFCNILINDKNTFK